MGIPEAACLNLRSRRAMSGHVEPLPGQVQTSQAVSCRVLPCRAVKRRRKKAATGAALSPDRCGCDHDRVLRRPAVFFAGAFFDGAGVSTGASVSLKPTIPPSYASASNVRALSIVRP